MRATKGSLFRMAEKASVILSGLAFSGTFLWFGFKFLLEERWAAVPLGTIFVLFGVWFAYMGFKAFRRV